MTSPITKRRIKEEWEKVNENIFCCFTKTMCAI